MPYSGFKIAAYFKLCTNIEEIGPPPQRSAPAPNPWTNVAQNCFQHTKRHFKAPENTLPGPKRPKTPKNGQKRPKMAKKPKTAQKRPPPRSAPGRPIPSPIFMKICQKLYNHHTKLFASICLGRKCSKTA